MNYMNFTDELQVCSCMVERCRKQKGICYGENQKTEQKGKSDFALPSGGSVSSCVSIFFICSRKYATFGKHGVYASRSDRRS